MLLGCQKLEKLFYETKSRRDNLFCCCFTHVPGRGAHPRRSVYDHFPNEIISRKTELWPVVISLLLLHGIYDVFVSSFEERYQILFAVHAYILVK